MRYLAIVICIMLILPVYGQKKKKDEETGVPAFMEGVVYALPRTGIKVYVNAVKETFVPGPYAGYADQLLGIKDAKTSPSVKWYITDVKIETTSEPDPAQVHKALGEGAYLVSLTPDGCIVGINTPPADFRPSQDITGRFIQSPALNDGFSFDYFTDTPLYIQGDSTNNFRPTRVSAEMKAAEAAKRVLQSRMNQYDLAALRIDGEYPDGKAYEVSLAELKRTEDNYVSLFVGRTTVSENSFSVDFMPEKAGGKGDVIFRISDENGVVPASDLSGRPVMIEMEVENSLVQNYTNLAKSDNPSAGESGVYYRLPAMTNIKLISDLKVIATARIPIAQFGIIAPVPEEMLYGGYSIKFHPETGAIQSIVKNKQ
ncbi:MAG: DUF4831 family protein [Draconibacterium sp.]